MGELKAHAGRPYLAGEAVFVDHVSNGGTAKPASSSLNYPGVRRDNQRARVIRSNGRPGSQ